MAIFGWRLTIAAVINNEIIKWYGNHPPWEKDERKTSKYKHWRTSVFERDNYICQQCGQKGGELNAHHIKFWAKHPKIRFDIDNGITLCKECHKNIHKNKKVV